MPAKVFSFAQVKAVTGRTGALSEAPLWRGGLTYFSDRTDQSHGPQEDSDR